MRCSAKFSGSATPCARPTATTSRMMSSAKARVSGLARIGPMVVRIEAVTLDIAVRKVNFCHSSSVMSAGISALMPPALQASQERLRARRDLVVVFAEGEPLHRAGLADHARPRDRDAHVGRAAEQRLAPDDRRQHVVLLHAVLQRDDAGVGAEHGQDRARGGLGVAQLHGKDHHVDLADGRGIVGRLHLGQLHRLVAFDRETVLPHRLEVGAARHEGHVRAAGLQLRAVVAADAARTHDRDLHAWSCVAG